MKKKNTTLLSLFIASGITIIPFALTAEESKKAIVQEYQLPVYEVGEIAELPVPIEPSIPVIPRVHGEVNFAVTFTLNERGIPKKVNTDPPVFALGILEDEERDLGVQMRDLVSTWRFKPALDTNGNPVKVKVTMPVKITKKGTVTTGSLILEKGSSEKERGKGKISPSEN